MANANEKKFLLLADVVIENVWRNPNREIPPTRNFEWCVYFSYLFPFVQKQNFLKKSSSNTIIAGQSLNNVGYLAENIQVELRDGIKRFIGSLVYNKPTSKRCPALFHLLFLFVDGQKKKRNRWPSFHPASELTEFDSPPGAARYIFPFWNNKRKEKFAPFCLF